MCVNAFTMGCNSVSTLRLGVVGGLVFSLVYISLLIIAADEDLLPGKEVECIIKSAVFVSHITSHRLTWC